MSLLACKDKGHGPGAPPPALIVMNSKSAPSAVADFKGKNTLKGTVNLDGTLPAGTRVMLALKMVGTAGAGFRTLDDGGDCTTTVDLTAATSSIPFEINELIEGTYRLKMLAFVDLKARLKDPQKRLLGKDDYAGVYTGADAATPDFKQAKPIEVKGEKPVEVSFRIGKIQ